MLIGAILHSVATPDTSRYAYRVRDVDGLITLVNARGELRAQRIPPAGVAEALASSPWAGPYDGERLQWDANDNTLFFTSPDPQSRANRLRYLP